MMTGFQHVLCFLRSLILCVHANVWEDVNMVLVALEQLEMVKYGG